MSGSRWLCTDVGSRLVLAIKLDLDDDPSWYSGPPYAVVVHTIGEYEIDVCSLTRHGGNTYDCTDEEIEQSRYSGKDAIEFQTPPPMSPEERESFEVAARENLKAMRAKWIEEAPMREQQEAIERVALLAHRAAMKAAEQKDRPQPDRSPSSYLAPFVRNQHYPEPSHSQLDLRAR
jgi:hypothetical protein